MENKNDFRATPVIKCANVRHRHFNKARKKTIAAVFLSFSFPLNFVAVLAQWTPLSFRRYGANDTFDV